MQSDIAKSEINRKHFLQFSTGPAYFLSIVVRTMRFALFRFGPVTSSPFRSTWGCRHRLPVRRTSPWGCMTTRCGIRILCPQRSRYCVSSFLPFVLPTFFPAPPPFHPFSDLTRDQWVVVYRREGRVDGNDNAHCDEREDAADGEDIERPKDRHTRSDIADGHRAKAAVCFDEYGEGEPKEDVGLDDREVFESAIALAKTIVRRKREEYGGP